jgi:hypothetical protein
MSESEAPGISIPEDLFDRHFGDDTDWADDTVEDGEDPGESDDELPGDDEADTPEDGDGQDPDPTEDDDDTGEGDDEPEGDAEDDEGAPQEDDDGVSAPKFDRRKLEAIKDPEARRLAESAIKSFQSEFTRGQQRLAAVRKTHEAETTEARAWKAEYAEWVRDIATPAGGEHMLLTMTQKRPDLFSETVLVDLALKNPDAFAAAYERAQELAEDGRARKVFEGERDLKIRDHRDNQQKASDTAREQTEAQVRLERLVRVAAGAHDIRNAASLGLVTDSVDAFLMKAQRAGRKVSADDVKAHVESVAKRLVAEKKNAARAEQQKGRKERQDRVREDAKKAKQKRPAPPGTATPTQGKDWKMPEREDDVFGAAFDRFFGS